jgi:copper chaperone CopZ
MKSPIHLAIVMGAALALAGCGARESERAAATPEGPNARVVNLEVGGMVCGSCVQKVQAQLAAVPGVKNVRVSLKDQRASVACAGDVADSSLTAAVRRAGPDYVALVVRP